MSVTERLVIDLPAELVDRLKAAVAAGEFDSESELVRAAVQVWYGGPEEPNIETLKAFVAEGLAEADAEKFIEADEVHAELRDRIKAIANRRE